MIQSLPAPVTFDQSITWYPENSERRYELHDGDVTELPKPTGNHSEVAGFIVTELNFEIRRLQLPYFLPRECIVRSSNAQSGYEPDAIVLNREAVKAAPRWERESVLTRGDAIKLIVEVVSTNWSDDYALKLEDYEAMGISEDWIVDYLGLGGKRFIGTPKLPTLSICTLVNETYEIKRFRGNDRLESATFPDL